MKRSGMQLFVLMIILIGLICGCDRIFADDTVIVQIGSDTLTTRSISDNRGVDWAEHFVDFVGTVLAVVVGGLVTAVTTYILAQKQVGLNLAFEQEKDFRARFSKDLLDLILRTEKEWTEANRVALITFVNSQLPLFSDRFSDELNGRLWRVESMVPRDLENLRKSVIRELI